MSVRNVCSLPTDCVGGRGRTRRGSSALASACNRAPTTPNVCVRSDEGSAASWPMVRTPHRWSASPVRGPTPRRHAREAVGFVEGGAPLRPRLHPRHADGDRQAALPLHILLNAPRDLRCRTEERLAQGHVQEGLVDGDWLHLGGVALEDGVDLARRPLLLSPPSPPQHPP